MVLCHILVFYSYVSTFLFLCFQTGPLLSPLALGLLPSTVFIWMDEVASQRRAEQSELGVMLVYLEPESIWTTSEATRVVCAPLGVMLVYLEPKCIWTTVEATRVVCSPSYVHHQCINRISL